MLTESSEELSEDHLNNKQQTHLAFEQKTEQYSRQAELTAQTSF